MSRTFRTNYRTIRVCGDASGSPQMFESGYIPHICAHRYIYPLKNSLLRFNLELRTLFMRKHLFIFFTVLAIV